MLISGLSVPQDMRETMDDPAWMHAMLDAEVALAAAEASVGLIPASATTAMLSVLDDLGEAHVSFCGLSLGGAVGQWIAAHAPRRLERLLLCATAARFTSPEVYLERAAIVQKDGMEPIASSVMGRWFTAQFRKREPEVIDRFRDIVAAMSSEGYAQCCEAVATFDGRPDLARIAAPTLIIVGADDPATPPDLARVLHKDIAGSTLTVIQQAAHLVTAEQPDAVGTAIFDHLR